MPLPGPDTRVVELRMHGIMGSSSRDLVDAVAAVDVAGDGVGRIVRPADRLRRPAPGPVLQVGGRPTTRIVEGYLWRGMTSGGPAKATWALLFPFALANVAAWMLPEVPQGSRTARTFGATARALVRLAGLVLTVLLTAQLAVVSLDLFAVQCLRPGGGCLAAVPDWLRAVPSLRTAVGLLPVAIGVLVLHRISVVEWRPKSSVLDAGATSHETPTYPGGHLVADPDTPALRVLHVVAALAAAALLVLGGPLPPAAPIALGCWVLAVALLGLCVLGAFLLDDPAGGVPARGGRLVRRALGAGPRRVLLAVAALLLVAMPAVVPTLPARLPGIDAAVELIAAALAAVAVLLGVVLVPAAMLARRARGRLPAELRPWAGGWMAPPMLALAGLLGGGFGAGVGITVDRAFGGRLALPGGYHYVTLLWGLAAILGALGLLVLSAHAWLSKVFAWRTGKGLPPEVGLLHDGRAKDQRLAATAWWWARWQRNHIHQVFLALACVLSIGTAVSIVLRVMRWRLPEYWQWFSGLGVLALAAFALALLRGVYLAARKPNSARHLGSFADLACFWPREAHPVVPPCYALKTVPEVAARVREHLKDPQVRVVLTGHSQGSLLAAVAAGQLLEALPEHERERVGLVVAGSPLQWAYPRAFPAVVPASSLANLNTALDGRWRALCRGTDPLGGAVTTWRRQIFSGDLLGLGFRVGNAPGPLDAAVPGEHGALLLGGDHWLPDPQHAPVTGKRWRAGVSHHHDYYADPEWDRAVAIAAGLVAADSSPSQEPLFRMPGLFKH